MQEVAFPFRTREADLEGLGVGRLRRRGIAHPFTGVNVRGAAPADIRDRVDAYALLLRDGEAFSHATAALLWGAELPRDLEDGPIHVVRVGDTRARSRGMTGHRADPGTLHIAVRFGIPLVAPSDAWVQLAPTLSRPDLVAVGDRFVTGMRVPGGREDPVSTIGHLRAAVHRHRGGRGLRAARWALERVRVGVDSRRETRLRLALVLGGLPEPEVGVAIDVGFPEPVHPDLAYPELRVAIEYEGDEHRTDRRRWLADIARREAMEAAGWRVIRVTALDFHNPPALVARVRRVLRERAISAGI